ncbi:LLM class flavin-dependent oxidoreductase [Sciscionella marina]|uniref:LLM class flavin-dependent oxidoreductase n=1 Tax=Sciscionella marina TaxID=508770 RepID=UPI0012F64E82|nr:LLM class flavin-dependent oxidoreductase [Sciscionella marina]
MSPVQIQTDWVRSPGFDRRVLDPVSQAHVAAIAESGCVDYLFVPDKNTVNGRAEDDPTLRGNAWFEPITLMSYLAATTTHIGLVATASTQWFEPYGLARMFASLDHLCGGRAGWNAVSSHPGLEDHNYGHLPSLDSEQGHRRHLEFIEVVLRLWGSWEADAVVADAVADRWALPGSVRRIDHQGEFFKVAGPLNLGRSPQGRPLVVQAGESQRFRSRAAGTADIVFTRFPDVEQGRAFTADLRRRVERAGRAPGSVRVMPSAVISLGGEDRTSDATMAAHWHFCGSASGIAEQMIDAVDKGAADGFTVLPTLLPEDLTTFVGAVVPELQRAGAVPSTYTETLRERLGLPAVDAPGTPNREPPPDG